MQKIFFPILICLSLQGFAGQDTTKWNRAFPITGYLVDLTDSIKLVQVEMPEGFNLTEKEIGLVYAYGVYRTAREDAIFKGYGKCRLIKGDYYFAIHFNFNGKALQEGDIIYLDIVKQNDVFEDQLVEIATHYIQLLDVFDKPLYDQYDIFSNWTEADEKAGIDSIVADIRLTGNYFLQEDPSKDKPINEGRYKGKSVLTMMANCEVSVLKEFLDYMIARPRVYAGKQWKVSEIFATWLSNGAPMVIDN